MARKEAGGAGKGGRMPLRSIMLVAALAAATPALAEEGRALCPDRPGLGTPACTVDVGAVVLEVGVADWTLDDNADSRTDSWAFGAAVRIDRKSTRLNSSH